VGGDNEQLLRERGLIEGPKLPPDYSAFIESLSEEELRVLVELKRRLDEAGIPTATLRVAMPVL
jgi:hypothetical protein